MSTPLSPTLELANELIKRQSVTPEDAGCQDLMIQRLTALDFKVEIINSQGVTNFWARRGQQSPLFAFAGHTDVVPTGPLDQWDTPPFEPSIKDGFLYGRGAADMKGSLAAMVIAVESFVKENPNHHGSIAFLITSDEEGPATDGTVKVVEFLENRQEKIDYCLVGEPSSTSEVGDIIKNGRRGSLNAKLRVYGTQGHVAYPNLAHNPIHACAPAIAELSSTTWDHGNDFFPATTFQVSNFHSGSGATNVIPGEVDILLNFRFNTEQTPEGLMEATENILNKHDLNYEVKWQISGRPFLTQPGALVKACQKAILDQTQLTTELSTSGGTSDGRFIAPTGAQVVELGPCNKTIHKVNECVRISDLEKLTKIYHDTLVNLLT